MIKHDKLKEQETRKKAREKKAAEGIKKNTSKDSIITPRRTPFQTPSTNNEKGIGSSKTIITKLDKTSQIKAKDPRQALLDCISQKNPLVSVKQSEDNISDPRRALFQAITQKKSIPQSQSVPSNNSEEGKNESVLQSIIKKKANDSMAMGGGRKAFLQSIASRKSVTGDQKQGIDPRQALFQQINKRKLDTATQSDSKESQSSRESSKEDVESSDPRKVLLQSSGKQRSEKDLSIGMGNGFPLDSSKLLLQSIIQRKSKADEKSRVQNIASALTSEKNEENVEDDDGSSLLELSQPVVRTSRSLGCGIVPDWDCAVTTFDPS